MNEQIKRTRTVFLFSVALLSLLGGCHSDDEFTVEGALGNASSHKVYLAEIKNNQVIPMDTAVLTKDGRFRFRKKVLQPTVFEILAEGFSMDVVAEKNRTVFIKADLRDTGMNVKVYGSPENTVMQEFMRYRMKEAKNVAALTEELKTGHTSEDTLRVYEKNQLNEAAFYTEAKDFTLKHKNDFVSLYTVNYLSADKDYPLFSEIAGAAGARYRGNPLADSLTAFIKKEKPTAVGALAQPINLPGPDGKYHSLAELKGKYVMIDFWASWCAPCRRENPLNVRLFNFYRSKNFTLFGVSLDRDKNEWIKAIKDDNLTWTQVSELKEWRSEVVGTYNFQGIPHNVLLDKDGRILAKNLHGPELEAYLKKLLL